MSAEYCGCGTLREYTVLLVCCAVPTYGRRALRVETGNKFLKKVGLGQLRVLGVPNTELGSRQVRFSKTYKIRHEVGVA